MNLEYCDPQPASVDEYAVQPTQHFDRWIMAEVQVSCVIGYKGNNEQLLKVICAENEQTTGVWESADQCVGIFIWNSIPFATSILPS